MGVTLCLSDFVDTSPWYVVYYPMVCCILSVIVSSGVQHPAIASLLLLAVVEL